MNTIRMNPLRSREIPAEKMPTGATFGAPTQMASRVSASNPLFAHLGHFAQQKNLIAGHNTGGHSAAHPGFAALAARGVPAGALANTSRNASAAAKRKNPRLRKVKG